MRTATRRRSVDVLDIEPPGRGGLDQHSNPTSLDPSCLVTARNVVCSSNALSRRAGSAKVSRFSDPMAANASKVFGTAAKYATIPIKPQLLLGKGSFAIKFAMTAVRPAGPTGYVVSCDTDVAGTPPVLMRLSTAGVFLAAVGWSDATQSSVTTPALTSGATVTGLLVFDAVAGTLTLYLDGDVAGTPVTGLSSSKQPVQTPVTWYVGAQKAAGVVAAPFAGAIGPLTLFSFRGTDITAASPGGGPSILQELREGTYQDWPNPASRSVIFHYAMREASGSAMTDWSKFKNHGTYVGAYANAAGLVVPALNGNYVGTVRKAALGSLDGGTVNVLGCSGTAYWQSLEGGV